MLETLLALVLGLVLWSFAIFGMVCAGVLLYRRNKAKSVTPPLQDAAAPR